MATGTARVDDLIAQAFRARELGQLGKAIDLLQQARAAAPSDPGPRQLLGAILVDRDDEDDIAEAIAALNEGVVLVGPLNEHNAAMYNNLANALRRAQRFDEAEPVMRELVAVAPKAWEHWHNLGQLLKETGRLDEAAAAMRRAIALAPEFGPNHAVLGSILNELGRLRAGLAALYRCVELGWNTDADVWTAIGNTHRLLGELDQAVDALQRVMMLRDNHPAACSNLAIALNQRGEFAEAHRLFELAIANDPDTDKWRYNYGYSQLTAGIIPEGWHNWERALNGGPRGTLRDLGVAPFTPEDPGTRVLCYREQGVGDEIMFASCLPDLAGTVESVVYEADSRLVGLLARSFPTITVREQSRHETLGETMFDFDRSIPIGSLPTHFRQTLDAFPGGRPYLVADHECVDFWQERVAAVGHGQPTVGVSWRSRIQTSERRLEYTRLEDDWAPIFAIPGITWVNLQYDDCERELRNTERRYGVTIHRWDDLDYMNDFDGVAGLMHACDLVLSPRSAVAMLAGALGRPTVMIGNRWDWSDLGTDSSPWFGSLELVYRHIGDDWDAVIAVAAQRVLELTQGKS